ncbi:unnamed protein product [Linum tenue]|uniref:ACT domain-containing protein ACR n=3 Tax=Linum tenue TaxID=586396 RepID=A0AAV0J857_9ROSI|nr:unnamed protein product [Linum tenue]
MKVVIHVGFFLAVFHVTDQLGNKLTDESLILRVPNQTGPTIKRQVRPSHVSSSSSSDHTALEITGIDRPGLLSEISAVLAQLECHVTAAVAWTHSGRAAVIIYVEEGRGGGPIVDSGRLAHVQEQLENVVEAHHGTGERRSVRLTDPKLGRTHTERRLHQLLYADLDYTRCQGCNDDCAKIHVTIEPCEEKGYSIVNLRSADRPKLLFDTVCALTDMEYVVFHAAVSSLGTLADQEYFIRQKDGCTLEKESERHKLSQCLIAAIERRDCDGLRLDVCTMNRMGLLSDVTRAFRENGLSISRAEVGRHGEMAIGSFYVTEASSGGSYVSPETVEQVRKELGESIVVVDKLPCWNGEVKPTAASKPSTRRHDGSAGGEKPRFSLGTLFWAHLGWLSSNFGSSIRS